MVRPLSKALARESVGTMPDRYMLFQHTGEGEWSELVIVHYMLIGTFFKFDHWCLNSNWHSWTHSPSPDAMFPCFCFFCFVSNTLLTDCPLPPWLLILKVTCSLPLLFPFFESHLSWGLCPQNSSHFTLSLGDLLYLWASKTSNLFLSFRPYSLQLYYLLWVDVWRLNNISRAKLIIPLGSPPHSRKPALGSHYLGKNHHHVFMGPRHPGCHSWLFFKKSLHIL